MKNLKGTISVIVPVYNVEKYLADCVSSIQHQTYKPLEIILVDDGSTDNSGVICDNLAKADSKIIVVHQNNKGLSGARNTGLEIARGEYISFIDSDDLIAPQMYEQMIEVIDGFDIIECNVRRFSDDINIVNERDEVKLVQSLSSYDALQKLVFNPGMTASFCNKLFRKEIFNGLRFKEGIIHEDEHLIFRVFDNINMYGAISNELYFYRTRENSIMTTKFSKKQLDAVWVWEDRQKYCHQKGYKDLELYVNAVLYYECCNLYKKKFFKEDQQAKQYLELIIDKYKKCFIHNTNIHIKHRIILLFGKLYRFIF